MKQAAISLVFAMGCRFDLPQAPSDVGVDAESANEMTFRTTIKPMVMRCLGPGCHGFSLQPNLTSYSALTSKYTMKPGSTNVLVTKGDHAGMTYLTAGEIATVESWINNLQ